MSQAVPAVAALPSCLLRNARLLSSRDDILPLLPRHAHIAEVGVMKGDFSEKFLKICKPSKFYAIDEFMVHKLPEVWGQKTSDLFENKTHGQFFKDRFASQVASGQVVVMEGDSGTMLASLADESLDVVYLDADHNYHAVVRDLEIARKKMKPHTGLVILNDYIMSDGASPYGVIQAGHEFMLHHGWEMVAFALHDHMYCDVVLRKMPVRRARRLAQRFALACGYTKLGRF
ncbi:class I SAM-dependent methyltransferase [Acetobacter sp. DsW_059]|uniref:class I SAM-dependent methyltransferase n=1 Tax=Acetobacter sp. DsW_059 TaxID=1670661 RepID=UPI000A387F5F|nr:class I SAM-dependent methyltransferase [Acetobacter sp. DsW_059]OUJ12046.1 hypothetical protein HK25_04420 [Acetobacter sp. DsW_059]